jgi:biotin carboxyl carrier protein
MPGVVLSVDVAPGTPVTRGQVLLVLEAMKMKNALRAESDGVVSRVSVAVGDQVRHGDLLVEFEA